MSIRKMVKENTIFINIAAYNEEDVLDTVSTAYSKAKSPENVYIGIVLHYPDKNFPDLSGFKNVKIIERSDTIGLGLGITRGLASSLYNNEEYYLQIDAHTVFKQNWDSILISNYKKLKDVVYKPIISTYVPYYYRDRKTNQNVTMAQDTDWEKYYEPWSLVSKNDPRAIGMEDKEKYYNFVYNIEALDSPAAKIAEFGENDYEEQHLVSGHFLFTSALFIDEVKYDPELAYHEENAIAMLAWTRGYRIFNIRDHVLWTRAMYTMGRDVVNSWKETYLKKDENGVCFRDKVIAGTLRNKDILTGKVIGEYGAPSKELLEAYEAAAGLDYKKFYQDMYETVEKTGDKYFAAKALYDLDKERNGR